MMHPAMKALLAVLAMAALIVVVMRMRAPYAYLGKGYCVDDNSYITDDANVRNKADSLDKCKAACDNNPECKYMAFDGTPSGTVCSLYKEVQSPLGCNPSGTLKRPQAQNYSSYEKKSYQKS
jgi:hypothetical protein